MVGTWRGAEVQTGHPITQYRGIDTATMVYDAQPINDIFRRVSDDTVLGLMDLRGLATPYFFSLRRNDSLPVGGNRR